MIHLITGLPGNGKTLYAIAFVKAWAEKEQRPVFYSGIAELTLPWIPCDPERWMDCPPKSIIVIDECQRIFRPRANGKTVPDYVSALETHRHQGLDIVLITQHPALCDIAIRRLAGRHCHVIRKWGTQAATVHEWSAVRDQCDKSTARKDSIRHTWPFPKAMYTCYKSAALHTVKRAIPMRVYFLFIAPLLIAVLAYMAYRVLPKGSDGEIPVDIARQIADHQNHLPIHNEQPIKANYRHALEDAKQFVFEHTPRMQDLPHTAPRYDEITKPTIAPLPAACVANQQRCHCWTQQATPMQVSEEVCRHIVAQGFFVDFNVHGSNRQQHNNTQSSGKTLPQTTVQ